jgi:hypothetical protein
MTRTVTVSITFNEEDLQQFLDYANFTDNESLQLSELSEEQFAKFKKEILDTADNFKYELMEGSQEACANDWLYEFAPEEE